MGQRETNNMCDAARNRYQILLEDEGEGAVMHLLGAEIAAAMAILGKRVGLDNSKAMIAAMTAAILQFQPKGVA